MDRGVRQPEANDQPVREYVKPGIVWEEPLGPRAEVALACGKAEVGSGETCTPGDLAS